MIRKADHKKLPAMFDKDRHELSLWDLVYFNNDKKRDVFCITDITSRGMVLENSEHTYIATFDASQTAPVTAFKYVVKHPHKGIILKNLSIDVVWMQFFIDSFKRRMKIPDIEHCRERIFESFGIT